MKGFKEVEHSIFDNYQGICKMVTTYRGDKVIDYQFYIKEE